MSQTALSHTLKVPLGTHFPRERHSGVSLYRVLRGSGMGTLTESRIILKVLFLSLCLMAAAAGGCELSGQDKPLPSGNL